MSDAGKCMPDRMLIVVRTKSEQIISCCFSVHCQQALLADKNRARSRRRETTERLEDNWKRIFVEEGQTSWTETLLRGKRGATD